MTSTPTNAAQPSLEARLGARLAGALSLHTQQLPHDISERLRVARDQATARARELRLKSSPSTTLVGISASGTAVLGSGAPWWQRAASVLPLVVLVSGLLMMDRWSVQEQVQAAAEIDAQLLTDTLPPAAYVDPGFAEYLRTTPTP